MKTKFIAGLILIFLQQFTVAQSIHSFRSITVDNGLSNFIVTAFYKDSTGFMWIGTDISLDRFDGVNFKHYYFEQADQNKVRIKSIAETTGKKLFIGNESGLWTLNVNDEKLYRFKPDLIATGVNQLLYSKMQDKLYVATTFGLFIIDNKNDEVRYKKLHGNILSASNNVTSLAFSPDKKYLWLATQSGIWKYNIIYWLFLQAKSS